jgi:hypothetical protein
MFKLVKRTLGLPRLRGTVLALLPVTIVLPEEMAALNYERMHQAAMARLRRSIDNR